MREFPKKNSESTSPAFARSHFEERREKAFENLPASHRNEYEHIIKELERPIEDLIRELSPEIKMGAYSIIVGDDASGRIPTFMIAHILKTIYEHDGRNPPSVRFIAGSTSSFEPEIKQKEVSEQFVRIKETMLKNTRLKSLKALIVTDTVDSGSSVTILLNGLRNNDIDADVATVRITSSYRSEKLMEEFPGTRVVWGKEGITSIYGKHGLAGVKKFPEDLFATPYTDSGYEAAHIDAPRAARAIAQKVAERIANRYLEGEL